MAEKCPKCGSTICAANSEPESVGDYELRRCLERQVAKLQEANDRLVETLTERNSEIRELESLVDELIPDSRGAP